MFPRFKLGSKTSFGVACSFFPPTLKFRFSQFVACFQCPFSLACTVANYGGCCCCCSYSKRVEKEKEVVAIQEHKKLASKRNLEIQSQEKSAAFNIKQ
jgi:hypothetical protein